MSTQTIQIDDLDTAIQQILEEYGDGVSKALGEACDNVAKEAQKLVKDAAPVDTGKYKKQIAVKKEHKSLGEVHNYVYVKSPDYRRAHLLENGHATAGGTGRVAAIPHFKSGEDYVKSHFEDELKKKVEDL